MDTFLKLLNSLSILIGIGVALISLRKWRAELFAKRRIELCEDILTRVYEVRDAIRGIRDPLVFGGEGSSRPRVEGETEEQRRRAEEAYVYVERFEKRREPFDALNKMRYRFMALYGEEWSNPFQAFVGTVNKIMVAAGARLREREDGYDNDPDTMKNRVARRERWDAVLYRIDGEPDAIDRDVEIAIQQLSTKCREEIARESSLLYGIL